MTPRHISAIILALAGAALVVARRYRNVDDNQAGYAVAGWTLFGLFWLLLRND